MAHLDARPLRRNQLSDQAPIPGLGDHPLAVGGGIRMNMSEKIDLRLQARLLLPMNFESGGFYFGSGGGGVSLSGGTIVPQGEATFCLTFKQAGSATVTK